MPPTGRIHAERREQRQRAQADDETYPNLLARIFVRLPLAEQCLTVSRLSTSWRRWAAPKHAELHRHLGRQPTLHEEVLEWATAVRLPLWSVREAWPATSMRQRGALVAAAAAQGFAATLAFAQQQGFEWGLTDGSMCLGAALLGNVGVLQWLRERKDPCCWDEDTCAAAAGSGHLKLLEWARQQQPPCPWDASACEAAAAGGHLRVLEFLRRQQPPCPWDSRTFACAAKGGHMAVLHWLRQQQPPCPWDDVPCAMAAYHGRLPVLECLRQQGAPWSRVACRSYATEQGHAHVVDWIDAQPDAADGEWLPHGGGVVGQGPGLGQEMGEA